MNTRIASSRTIDRVAIGLSGLCLAHCFVTAILLGTLSTFGAMLGNPIVHEVGLAIAICLGVVALGSGIIRHRRYLPSSIGALGIGAMAAALTLPHGNWEMVATMIGVILLSAGHALNRLALA